jgi:glycosyltransferase involved in cell wall biosynthesis
VILLPAYHQKAVKNMCMKILFVTDQYPPMIGGVPTLAHSLATDLAERGHHIEVAAPSPTVRDGYSVEKGVPVHRFASFEWPAYQGQRISFRPFLRMRTLIRMLNPDIIHIHSPIVLGSLAQMLGLRMFKPIIATNHFLPVNMHPALTSHWLVGKCISQVAYAYLTGFYNRCTYVTAPTPTALNLLREHGLLAPSSAISNGIDLRTCTPGPREPYLRQRLHLPEELPLVLHVNRLSKEKRIEVLLHSIPRMQSEAHFVLAGAGPEERSLRKLSEELGIIRRVSFLGYVEDEDLLALRRESSIFTIASEAELQSLSTMEAMACGLPVVAANACALPELVHHHENGMLFTPGQSDELAYLLDTLLQDEKRRGRMGRASAKIILAHNRDDVLARWEELYTRLVGELIAVQKASCTYELAPFPLS